jgi:type I restriction enzyme S subunit
MAANWIKRSLGDCADFFSGGTPSKSEPEYWGRGIPWVSAKDMKTFRLFDAEDHITQRAVNEGARVVSANTILLLVRGMTLHDDVPVCLTTRTTAFNQDVKAIKGKDGVSTSYLAYWLLANKSRLLSTVDSASHGTGRIPTELLKALEIDVPPEVEQERIAGVFAQLDRKSELNHEISQACETMSRAVFKAWFIDFEPVKAKAAGARSFRGMPSDIFDLLPDQLTRSELGLIPVGWQYVPIGDLIEVVGGGTPSTKNPEFWEGGEYSFCTPKDMSRLTSLVLLDTDRHITQAGVEKISSGKLPSGTVLLSSRAPIGYLAIAETPVSVNQGIIAMPPGKIPNTYTLLWTESNMEAIKARAGGSTFAEISKSSFRSMAALRPDEHTLAAFGAFTRPLFDLIACHQRESRVLAATRDALLPLLISGRIRVPGKRGVNSGE